MCCAAVAQKHDTLQTVRLITETKLNAAKASVPVQLITKQILLSLGSISVADAAKYFAGVNVKDYGGIGGLKTVSVRSLGANHTGVMYDGLISGDAQGGQTDLGKFAVNNIRQINFYSVGITEPLSPARAFASSSLISLQTLGSDLVSPGRMISASLEKGSFGYITPSFLLRVPLGKKFFQSVNGSYRYAKSDYPFLSYEDHRSIRTRSNSDINDYRAEYDAGYLFNDSNSVHFKAYYYNSKRGLPGAVILYNEQGNQRLNDEDIFLQACYSGKLSGKSALLLNTKFSGDKSIYNDPAYPNSYGKLVNDFHQQEIYFSAAYKYKITKSLSAGYASDVWNSKLKRTDIFAAGFAKPNRNSFLNNAALQFSGKRLEANANLLYTVINESVAAGASGKNLHVFTPAVSASAQIFKYFPLRLRGSFKKTFRAPTFNDLYYTNIGNVNLRPEYADEYDLGITFSKQSQTSFIKELLFTGDAYLNNVKDRILAVPRQNLFQWSMENVGRVRAKGIDAVLQLHLREYKKISFAVSMSYNFQQATDLSDRASTLYKTQLPYTPKHSGSISFSAKYKNATLGYNILMSSDRYRLGDQVPENIVQGWQTNDVTFNIIFREKRSAEYYLFASANNIWNTQYEIIKFYPMPRFNYRFGFTVNLHQPSK